MVDLLSEVHRLHAWWGRTDGAYAPTLFPPLQKRSMSLDVFGGRFIVPSPFWGEADVTGNGLLRMRIPFAARETSVFHSALVVGKSGTLGKRGLARRVGHGPSVSDHARKMSHRTVCGESSASVAVTSTA